MSEPERLCYWLHRDGVTDRIAVPTVPSGGVLCPPPWVLRDFAGRLVAELQDSLVEPLAEVLAYAATADATTIGLVRPWFYVPDHAPGGVPEWLAGHGLEDIQISAGSTDVYSPTRRINSVPAGATQMYLQVVSIVGTAPVSLYMVVFGLSGIVATVDIGDIEVDVDASGITLGAVKLEDGATANRALVQDANGATAATDHVLVVQPRDNAGNIIKPNSMLEGMAIYSIARGDFTAVYTAATQITLAGLPFVPVVSQFVFVTKWGSTGVAVTYTPSTNAFVYVGATGVLTITGAAFAATDVGYEVAIIGPPKAYNAVADVVTTWETNPASASIQSYTLAQVTNGADATYPYYVDGTALNIFMFQLSLNGGTAAGTVTATIAGTLQDDGTAAASCTYEDITASFGGALIAPANTTVTDVWAIDTPQPWRYIRIQIVAASTNTTGDWTIFFRGNYS